MTRRNPLRPWVGVGAVIVDGDRALLVRRSNPPYDGYWSIPGGAVEAGETLEEAIKREIREECSLEVELGDIVAVLDSVQSRDGKLDYHYVLVDFLARVISGHPKAGTDASGTAWVRKDELSRYPLTPRTAEVLRRALSFAPRAGYLRPGQPLKEPWYLSVIGAAECGAETALRAEEVGRIAAREGAILVCGGRGGVMEAASRGASMAGGTVVGILPGPGRGEANPYVTVALPTGLGEARNALVARAADVVIAIDGGYGTLSEIALALKMGKPVISLGSWRVDRDLGEALLDTAVVSSPAAAVAEAMREVGLS